MISHVVISHTKFVCVVRWREAEPWIILQFYVDLLLLDEFQGLAFVSKGECYIRICEIFKFTFHMNVDEIDVE